MINDLDIVQWEYLLSPEFELINSAGKPLTGGWIEVYLHGTRDKYYCASDFDGTLHPFKIPLDSIGANVVLADPNNAYDVYVYNKFGSLIMSRYNVKCQGSGGSSTYVGDKLYYGQYRANNVTTIANLRRNKGNINITDDGYLELKSGMSYHITVRGSFTVDNPANEDTTLNYIEYTSVNPIKIDIDETKEGPQYFELSYDIYRLQEDMDYQVAFAQSNGLVKDLIVEVHSLSNLATSATGGEQEYEAGWGIDITNNVVSVDPSIFEDYTYTAGDYISIDGDNVISVTGINPADYATHDEVYEATVTAIEFVSGMIPSSQMQSDWDQDDSTQPDYIKNKPDLSIYATHDELNTVSGILHEEINNIDLSDYSTHTEVYEATVTAIDYVTGIIPEAQVQSDWNQNDNTQPDYIKNKPTIPSVEGLATVEQVSAVSGYLQNEIDNIPAQVQSDWTEDDNTDPAYIKNKPDEYNLVAGNNIAIAVTGTDIVISSTGGGGGSTYTAGENIEIDNDVISVKDVILINARSESASGRSAFGNVTHWGNQDYGPGWWISAHTDNDKDYVAYNSSDLGQEEFYWGEYATDRENNGVSAVSQLSIHEGDITYKAGEFQDVRTLPIIWSCNKMAQDITNLQSAITAIPPTEYTAGTGIDITNNTISVDNTVAMKTDIPTLPDDQEVVFEELDLSDYALASTVPTIQLNSNDQVTAIDGHTLAGSGSGSTYTAGEHISIENDEIAVTGITELVAGENITITTSGASAIISGQAGADSNIFIADVYSTAWNGSTYNDTINTTLTTPYSDVLNAYNQGKTLICRYYVYNSSSQIYELRSVINFGEMSNHGTVFNFIGRANGMVILDVSYSSTRIDCMHRNAQADWNATSNGSPDYIKNKPSIPVVELNSSNQVTAIDGHTIAGGGSSYTAGTGIDITNDVISVDNTVAMKTDIPVVTGFATKTELATVEDEIPTLPTEEEVDFQEIDLSDYALASAIPDVSTFATKSELQTVSATIPDTTDMATQTWVGDQGYLTSVPSNYVTDSELNGAVSGLATKTEVTTGLGTKQNMLTGITDVQVVQTLPVSPVSTVLYLIPEA